MASVSADSIRIEIDFEDGMSDVEKLAAVLEVVTAAEECFKALGSPGLNILNIEMDHESPVKSISEEK